VGTYTGLDLSTSALARARARLPEVTWQRADAARLPHASASFDVVAFSSVLHHLPSLPPALAEAYRVLKPGGLVFAFDPNLLNPAMAILRHPRSPFYLSEGVSPDEKPLLPSALERAFLGAGFRDVLVRGKAGISYRSVAPRGVDALLALYNAADQLLAWSGLGRWIGTFAISSGRKPEGGAA
jgi:SAM-dependent methyltransferase